MSSKWAKLTSYDYASTHKTLVKMMSHPRMGNWHRGRQSALPTKSAQSYGHFFK